MNATAWPMTFAEFEQLPDMPGKQELIHGQLVLMPPPELNHQEIATRLLRLFYGSEQPCIWPDNTGYRTEGGLIVPDISISWPDQRRDEKYFLGAPKVAVEILSPGENIDEKIGIYFSEGALELWVLDRRDRSMTVYRRSGHQIVSKTVKDEYRSEAAGVTVRVAELFG